MPVCLPALWPARSQMASGAVAERTALSLCMEGNEGTALYWYVRASLHHYTLRFPFKTVHGPI